MDLYRISGLTVASDIPLPAAEVLPDASTVVDARLRVRPTPERLAAPRLHGPTWELDDRSFLLSLPGIGRFLAQDGRTLDMQPLDGTSPEDALPFLLGTGFGALLHQRGGLVLHAAAVASDGVAYVFCGRSGEGKSTLAAALCAAGCRFVSDDMTAIGLGADGRPVIWPDGRRLKLFDQTIERLALGRGRRAPVRSGTGKFYVDPPGADEPLRDEPLRLGGIYLLGRADMPEAEGIEPVPRLDAALVLLNESYRRRLALAYAGPAQVAVTAATVGRVPVFRMARRRGLERLPSTVDELRASWRDPPRR